MRGHTGVCGDGGGSDGACATLAAGRATAIRFRDLSTLCRFVCVFRVLPMAAADKVRPILGALT